MGLAGLAILGLAVIIGLSVWAFHRHQKSDPLKKLPPAVYQPTPTGDTLPLPKK
jgi:hypothetical protein